MKTPLMLDDRRLQLATGLHCGLRPASQTAPLHSGGLASNRTIWHFGDLIFATSHSFHDTPRMAAQRRPLGWVECIVLGRLQPMDGSFRRRIEAAGTTTTSRGIVSPP
jgi:hypothetical protein